MVGDWVNALVDSWATKLPDGLGKHSAARMVVQLELS